LKVIVELVEDLVVSPSVTLQSVPLGRSDCVNVTVYELDGGGEGDVTVNV
jgi:hypothetical protein